MRSRRRKHIGVVEGRPEWAWGQLNLWREKPIISDEPKISTVGCISAGQTAKTTSSGCVMHRLRESFLILLYVYGCFCLHARLCTMCVPSWGGVQNMASDPVELKLQIFVICHVDDGNQIRTLWKSNRCLEEQQMLLTAKPSLSRVP